MTIESVNDSVAMFEPGSVLWTGRSGRRYTMSMADTDTSSLQPARLYVLAGESVIRWVGTAEDLIADQTSRARFRAAVSEGAQMLSLSTPVDDLARMTLIWDLEGTRRPASRNAA